MGYLKEVDKVSANDGKLTGPMQIQKEIDRMEETTLIYRSAIKEVKTKLRYFR